MKYWDKEKVINTDDEVDQIEIIQRDFMSIFGQGKMKIETLRIEDRPGNGFFRHSEIGKRALLRTFNELFNKLKVRNLEYSADDWDFALVVALRTIDPEQLKFLKLEIKFMDNLFTTVWKDLPNLEQWKRLKTFDVRVPQVSVSDIISFNAHVENTFLTIDDFNKFVTNDGVIQLKNVNYLSHHYFQKTGADTSRSIIHLKRNFMS